MSEISANEKKDVTIKCEKHGDYTGTIRHYFFGGVDRELPSLCPACQKEIEEEKRLEEQEAERQQIIKKWRQMKIDERYYEVTLDNFDAYNDELKEYLETCRKFAKNPDGKIVMLGKNGSGKTHLAVGVLKELGGVIYTAYDIGVNLRQSYNSKLKEHEVYDELCTAPLLVIDEIEKLKDSEAKQNWMSHVIGKRYNRLLPMIIIANCHTKKDCKEQIKPCPQCLEYHLESDVISRIVEDGIILKFSSSDYRMKIRETRFGRGK
jgi:DNA replication protein DnaC